MSERVSEMTIEELGLSYRAYCCLKRAGYDTVEQIIDATEVKLAKIPYLGRKSFDEVIMKLGIFGFRLKEDKNHLSSREDSYKQEANFSSENVFISKEKQGHGMTEQDKLRVINLWLNGMSLEQIQQILPYSTRKFREAIAEMKANGEFPTERQVGKDKVAEAVKNGELNPYVLAETYGVTVRTAREYKRTCGGVSTNSRPKFNYQHCDRTNAIIDDLKEGELSLSEIARKHGVSRQAVFIVKKKIGKSNDV